MSKYLLAMVISLVSISVAQSSSAASRYVGDGASVDFSIEVEGKQATLYLSGKSTNEPISQGTVVLAPDEESVSEVAFTPLIGEAGVYRATLASNDLPEGSLKVTSPNFNDEVEVYLDDQAKPASPAEAHKSSAAKEWISPLVLGISAFSLFFVGILLGRRFSGEPEKKLRQVEGSFAFDATEEKQALEVLGKAGVFVLSVVGAGFLAFAGNVYAHEGHTHGEAEIEDGGKATTLKVSKKSQFLVGLRTKKAVFEEQSTYLQSFGRVTGMPQADTVIQAANSGFVAGLQVSLGSQVRKGQVLGYVEGVARQPLVAPLSGSVVEFSAVNGSRVDAGHSLMRIVDTSKLWIEAEVFQKDLSQISNMQTAQVWVEGHTTQALNAKVLSIRTPVNAQSLSSKVYLEIENGSGSLPVGATARIAFRIVQKASKAVTMPRSAVLNRGGERIVFVQTGPESFESKAVNSSYGATPDTVSIHGGLKEGERVVVMGNYQLLLGAK